MGPAMNWVEIRADEFEAITPTITYRMKKTGHFWGLWRRAGDGWKFICTSANRERIECWALDHYAERG